MLLPLSESYSPEDPSSSHIHSFVPPDLTGQIIKLDDQYCAAGSFGDVYRCQYHSEFGVKEVAVKTLRFEFTVEEGDVDGRSNRMGRRELGIWKRLSHPNIVPFLGTVSGFGRLGNASLVSSWMPNGTLQDFLLKYDDKLTVAHRLQFLLGIASGLQYLHSLSIAHGDLTCNNVLLDEKCNARLTDFGYASLVGEMPEALAYLQASTLRPGAVRWAAPEYFSSSPEEMCHCTIKGDIYSFGNIALQALSGELPWSEFRRDAVVVLHLAKGDKPRRPQSHPINDQHWGFIEHCWSPVQERPSAEHLVLSIQHFSRSYPHSQPLCGLLISSEKSNSQSTLSGPLLSSPDIGQLSSDSEVPCTVENLCVMAPIRQHDLLSSVGVSSPPRAAWYPPQLTPGSNSSVRPLLPREPRAHSDPGDDHGNETTSQTGRVQSTLECYNQNGQAVKPDISATDTVFPQPPPPVHSKFGPAFPPFLNSSSIGQNQPNIYPFSYPFSQEYSVPHQHTPGTPAFKFGFGDGGATSGPRDGRGGILSFLSRGFGASARKSSRSSISGADVGSLPPRYPVARVQPDLRTVTTVATSFSPFANLSGKPTSSSQPPPRATVDPTFSEDIPVYPRSLQASSARRWAVCRPMPNPSRRLLPRSHGSGDGTLHAFSSNRPSQCPGLLAAPEFPSTFALTDQQFLMSLPDPPQSNNGIVITIAEQTVTNERTASASHHRRKQDANFLCPVPSCGSSFTRSSNLRCHMRSHNEERPFQCKWPGCGRGFVRKHSCGYHEQFLCKNRPFTCEGCDKIFPRMSALDRHLRSRGGAECKHILDISRVSERLPVPTTEGRDGLA